MYLLVESSAENLTSDLAKDLQWDFPTFPLLFSTLSDCMSLTLHHTGQHVAEFFSLSINNLILSVNLFFEANRLLILPY